MWIHKYIHTYIYTYIYKYMYMYRWEIQKADQLLLNDRPPIHRP